jgi:hypothetical protein
MATDKEASPVSHHLSFFIWVFHNENIITLLFYPLGVHDASLITQAVQ